MLGENEVALNLADLDVLFFGTESGARKCYDQVRRRGPGELDTLIFVDNEEGFTFREKLNDFLEYCAILEMASDIGYVSQEDVRVRYWSHSPGSYHFGEVLTLSSITTYCYQNGFRVGGFISRLSTGYIYVQEPDEFSEPAENAASGSLESSSLFTLFHRFLGMIIGLSNSGPAKAFFRSIDSHDGDIESLTLASDPRKFLTVLVKPIHELGKPEFEALGLHSVLAFSLQMESLLQSCTSPDFGRAVMNFCEPYRRYGLVLEDAVQRILSWPDPEADVDEYGEDATRLQRAIFMVFSAAKGTATAVQAYSA